MDVDYYNYSTFIAETWYERDNFVRNWRKMGQFDQRWTPPTWATQRLLRRPSTIPAFANQEPLFIHLEALSRNAHKSENSATLAPLSFERPVAAAIVLPHQTEQTAYIAWLQLANDKDPLDRFLGVLMEQMWHKGINKIVVSTGLSPWLGSGILLDHFNLAPPLHTPYNPPFYPELLQSSLVQSSQSRLYTLPIATTSPKISSKNLATLVPLDPSQLSDQYLGLLQAACAEQPIPPPTIEDVDLMKKQLAPWPLSGWLALVDNVAVGFVLLQPDAAPALRRARGGRNWIWRAWIHLRKWHSFTNGRILFGCVLPKWRRRGIGTQLLAQTIRAAEQFGWQELTIGPLAEESTGAAFLVHAGARPQQTYALYAMET